MWNRRTLLTAAASAASPLPAFAQAGPRPGRRAEAETVRRFAETTHPRGRDAALDPDWVARWDRLAASADTASDGAYVVGLRRALAWFRDGHTTAAPHPAGAAPDALKGGAWGLNLPLTLTVFDDGLWVTAAGSEAADLTGRRLTAINDVSANEIMRRHAEAWPGNDAWVHAWGGEVLTSVGDLTGLGVVPGGPDAKIRVAAEGANGSVIERAVTPTAGAAGMTTVDHQPGDVERWTAQAGGRNFLRRIEDGRTLFLSLDEMGDIEERSFLDLTRTAINAMTEPETQRVVIDLRRNGGGNNGLGEPLRKHLERSRFNRPGGLYVLIGPRTFSAAQNLATRLERETHALFAGGASGGAPNHYGDARRMIGEATGLPVFVSTLPWFDSAPQDQRPWILPDLPAGWTFDDWKAGRDPALAAVLADATTGEGDDLTLVRTFPWRRPSQTIGWAPFWRQA